MRGELEVPFQMSFGGDETSARSMGIDCGGCDTTIGMQVSKIHAAVLNGSVYIPVMECLREVEGELG